MGNKPHRTLPGGVVTGSSARWSPLRYLPFFFNFFLILACLVVASVTLSTSHRSSCVIHDSDVDEEIVNFPSVSAVVVASVTCR